MVARVSLRDPVKEELKRQKQEEIARNLWINSNNDVNRTYRQDPRTALGSDLMTAGSATDPVAGWGGGIARLGQGILGGIVNKQQRDKYGGAEGSIQGDIQASVPPPSVSAGDPAAAAAVAGAASPIPPPPVPPPAPPPDPRMTVASALTGQGPAGTAPPPPVIPNPTAAPVTGRGNAMIPTPMRSATVNPPLDASIPTAPSRKSAVEMGILGGRQERQAALQQARFGGRDDPFGAYGAVLGFGEFGRPPKPIPNMSIGEVIDFGRSTLIPNTRGNARLGLPPDKGSSAAGAFQFTGETLQRIAPRVLGKNWQATPFTPDVQNQLGKALFDESKSGNLKAIWTSLPDATPGAYANVPWRSMKQIIMEGESGAGGSVASTGGGQGGTDAYGVPVAPQMEVTPLAAAPTAPERPTLPDPIKSARMEAAQRLMGIQSGPGHLGAAQGQINELYGPAFEDVQANATARDTQQYGLTKAAYDTELGNYGTGVQNRYQAELGQTTADQAANRALHAAQYGGDIAAQSKATENQFLADESEKERKAKLEAAHIKAAAFKPPAFASKEYYSNVDKISTGGTVLQAVDARPKSLGVRNYLGQALTQRTDPEGVAARAAVAKYAGLLLHGISGAAVTPEEYARNSPWLPAPTDTPDAVKTKMARIMNDAQMGIDNLRGIYGTEGGFGYQPGVAGTGFSGVLAAGTQSPNWGKAERVR